MVGAAAVDGGADGSTAGQDVEETFSTSPLATMVEKYTWTNVTSVPPLPSDDSTNCLSVKSCAGSKFNW
jgi:hypothetical protein